MVEDSTKPTVPQIMSMASLEGDDDENLLQDTFTVSNDLMTPRYSG